MLYIRSSGDGKTQQQSIKCQKRSQKHYLKNCKNICLRKSSCAVCAHNQKILACHFYISRVRKSLLGSFWILFSVRFLESTQTWFAGTGPSAAVGVRLHEWSESFEILTSFLAWGSSSSGALAERRGSGWMRGRAGFSFFCWEGLSVETTKFLHSRLDLL